MSPPHPWDCTGLCSPPQPTSPQIPAPKAPQFHPGQGLGTCSHHHPAVGPLTAPTTALLAPWTHSHTSPRRTELSLPGCCCPPRSQSNRAAPQASRHHSSGDMAARPRLWDTVVGGRQKGHSWVWGRSAPILYTGLMLLLLLLLPSCASLLLSPWYL